MSTRAVYQPLLATATTHRGERTCGRHGLLDTTVWTWAVYRSRFTKQTFPLRSCISPARYNCISTESEPKAKSLLKKHSHVNQIDVNHDQKSEKIFGAAAYQPRSAKKGISDLYINTNLNQGRNTSGRHSCVDLGGVSTAIITAKTYLAQLCITSAV